MTKKPSFKSALSVNAGVEQPPAVSPSALDRFLKTKRKNLKASDYMDGILSARAQPSPPFHP